tara:strand:+ start:66 stop:764 length:699 start_codon:yes stop_codon:yes gene_type:complete
MRIFWATSLVLFLPATSVVADIYDDCQAAISEGNAAAVDEIANKLQRFNSLPQRSLMKAEACVSASVGVPMVYSSLGWIELSYREVLLATKAAEEAARLEAQAAAEEAVRSRICEIKGLVTQYGRTIDEAEAARQDRRIETLSATVQECSLWYDVSPKEALTNDICNSIFAAGGLPNSTISGPSQSELLLAELSKQNAETELEILVASGMLIEDFIAQYKSDETEDVYGCDQ